MGSRALTESGGTCAGSPGRRASSTGQPPEVGLVRARQSRQQPAPPRRTRSEPPSSAAARVAEAREVERSLSGNGARRQRGRSRRTLRRAWRPKALYSLRARPPAPLLPPPAGRSGTRAVLPGRTSQVGRRRRAPPPTVPLPPGGRGDLPFSSLQPLGPAEPEEAGPNRPSPAVLSLSLTRSRPRSKPSAFRPLNNSHWRHPLQMDVWCSWEGTFFPKF